VRLPPEAHQSRRARCGRRRPTAVAGSGHCRNGWVLTIRGRGPLERSAGRPGKPFRWDQRVAMQLNAVAASPGMQQGQEGRVGNNLWPIVLTPNLELTSPTPGVSIQQRKIIQPIDDRGCRLGGYRFSLSGAGHGLGPGDAVCRPIHTPQTGPSVQNARIQGRRFRKQPPRVTFWSSPTYLRRVSHFPEV